MRGMCLAGPQILASTKLGKTVFKLSKVADTDVADAAELLVQKWRQLSKKPDAKAAEVKEEVKAEVKAQVKAEIKAEIKAEVKAEVTREAKPQGTGEKRPRDEPAAAFETKAVKTENAGSGAAAAPSSSSAPVVLAKTGDAVRDSVRSKLREAFTKGIASNVRLLRELDVDASTLAMEAEEAMLSKYGGVTKEYQVRFRSLMFNLKDSKNPEFIRAVVLGQLHVADLADMDVKEMASAEMKKQRHVWSEHAKMALMDEQTYNQYTGKQVQDGILKCPKCKSMKTTYVEVQTRSADEPTTKKCLCTDCTYRWKFC
jgi:transcription elongation factor S-II